ncbi:MAG: hypothetical protein J1E37_00265 [Prevotella sp.]|nr:hypothetical protein [Prevotella sp.]
MKKLTVLCLLFAMAVGAIAADDKLTENFETGLPSSAPSSETTVTLSSGQWRIKGVNGKTDNGSYRAAMSSNGYLITPALNQPGKVTFYHLASGSGKKLIVEKSLDGGATWTELGTVTVSSSTPYGSASFNCKSAEEDTQVLIRFTCQSSTIYLDEVSITLNSVSSIEPEPDDPTYVTEGVRVPTKPFPTALKTIYIAPNGDDTNGDGSLEKPWFDLQKAINAAQPGTHIICRGGTYLQKVQSDGKFTVRIKSNGTAENPIIIRSYEDEKPIFDFRNGLTKERVGERGILMIGNHWWLFGLHITHAADNGIKLEGSYNRIERCEFSYNLDTGIQLGFGHDFKSSIEASYGVSVSSNDGTWCAYNDIIDCDSHHNCDCDSNYGSDADGFACKMHNGKGNRFIRCRAWRNSDDAWDLYETDYDVVLAECWAWESGKESDHAWVKEFINTSHGFSGNGNGIKLGGNGSGGSSKGIHYAFNCIAFGCNKSGSVKGFDCNSHKDGHVLVGCLAFDNGYDFMFESGGSNANTKYYNNICIGRQEICVGTDDYNAISSPMSKNGWTNHLITGIGKDDFISLDEDEALKPRDIYGGLPRKFGRLASDSQMIDQGNEAYEEAMPVWQQLVQDFPFLKRTITGIGRDLGPYERPGETTRISTISRSNGTAVNIKKYLKDGYLVIEKDGIRYNAIGQKL